MLAGAVFSVGKLWLYFGAYHNIMEFFIVAALMHKSGVSYVRSFIVILVYAVFVSTTVSQLEWYWDDFFFKFQGMIFDFTLPIYYFILMRQEKEEQEAPVGEGSPLLGGPEPRPRAAIYLLLASVIHLIGNMTNVIDNNSTIA
ncbi:17229_t:CDS:2 [Acaulospora colombiana]|uniref:17229_t:CDS:1 n=1 Tax=Acaulospora colombiana TaxID=27376 RepID=A0ACA9LBQ6_9GLOM|nr:17229_t:CDS:2 [Acaulospora colombiana]